MTELLQRAWQALQQLSPEDQDAIAARILAEVEDELAWEQSFATSQDFLLELAAEAQEDVRAGRFVEGGWDEL